MSATTTRAPWLRRPRTSSFPMMPAPPVTMPTRPERSNISRYRATVAAARRRGLFGMVEFTHSREHGFDDREVEFAVQIEGGELRHDVHLRPVGQDRSAQLEVFA